MPVPRLFLLGGVQVACGDRPIPFPPGPMMALLGYLGLYASGGRMVSRSRLAGSLWPDQPEARARRSLADTLYRVRRALGEESASDWIQADGETLALVGVQLDVADFRAHAGSAALADLREALVLYAGDLLEEVDAEWALGPRAELREMYLRTLERLCQALVDSGQLSDALTYAHRWSRADPLSEEACRSAMRLYARLGRHAAALQHYNRFAILLDDELQIEPLPETRALAASIRAEADRQAGEEAGALAQRLPFVGRRRERSALLHLAEEAQAGRGGMAFVEGDPGAGKTRLLETLADGAGWRGVTVVWGRARELAGVEPFAPLEEALQAAFAGPRLDQARPMLSTGTAAALAGLVPRLKPGRGPDPAAAGDLPSAVAEAMLALAGTSPHLFIFDDVQWARDEFWSAMLKVGPGLASRRLAMVLSYRSEEARADPAVWRSLRELERDLVPLKLMLGGLTQEECAELARSMGHPLDEAAAGALARRTGGNPFFVQELVGQVEAESASLRGIIERRLAGLSAESAAALEAGAVLGREFTHGPWQAVAGPGVLEEIPLLIAARFIEESEAGYRFQHDVTRERVYRSIAPERLRDLHRRAGEALLRERAEPAVLAWHFEQASQWPEAVRYHREAGDRAAGAYAYETSLAHYRAAGQLLDHLNDPEIERVALLLRQQRVYRVTVKEREWRLTVDALERAALAAGDRGALLEALQARISLYVLSADWDAMQAAAERAIALAQEDGDLAAEARTRAELGWHLADMIGRPHQALPHLERAAALAGQIGDVPLWLDVLGHLAFSQRMIGRSAAARETARRALDIAGTRDELRPGRAGALEILGQVEIDLANWQAAHETMRAFVELCTDLKARWPLGQGLFNQAFIAARIGQHAQAGRLIGALKQLLAEGGLGPPADHWMWTEALGADALAMAGDLEQAERALQAMRGWMASKSGGRPLLLALTALGRLRLAQNRPAEAREVLGRAAAVWEGSGGTIEVAPLLLHALAAHRAGEAAVALASLDRAERILSGTEVAMHNVLRWYARYEVLGDAASLRAAREEIQKQADCFTDPQLRAAFLEDVRLHREIEACWQTRQPAQFTARLARAGVPLGRALADDDRIEVRWTPDAGEADAALLRREGKIALRRHRLRRLMAEARSQGAAPTDSDLARALGVNIRTIERDLAALRQGGEAAPTRKRQA